MNKKNDPEEMTDVEISNISNLLRSQTAGLRFDRDIKFVKSKSPWAIGVAAATVTAIAVSLSLGGNSVSPAWAAEPTHPSESDRNLSQTSCTNANGAGDTLSLTQTSGFKAIDTHGNSTVSDLGGTPLKDSASTITLAQSPKVKAFDSRGKWNVTIMAGPTSNRETATIVCVTQSSGKGPLLGGTSVQARPSGSAPTDNYIVTTIEDGSKVSVGYGDLLPGAKQVILSAKGLPDAHASIENSSYAIWWPSQNSEAVVKQLDSSGKILETVDLSKIGMPSVSVLVTGGSVNINK